MTKKSLLFLILIFVFIVYKLTDIVVFSNESYSKMLDDKTTIYVSGKTAKRGRILDTNGKVIVDSKKVNAIYFHNNKNITYDDLNNISYSLSKYLSKGYKNKFEYIYNLLTSGYSYDNKLILSGISDEDYASILDMNLPGIYGDYIWERYYPYGNSLKSILGSVGKIPASLKEEYLAKGYNLNDTVGLSYLEYQYDDYLKGINAIYQVNQSDNSLFLYSEEVSGNDLVLSIDIDKQIEIENIIMDNITKAKGEANTDYYKESYAIVSDPSNGSIIAMSGKRYIKEDDFLDVTNNIINTSYVMGSVVKGATISVGYKYNIIDIGTSYKDSCVKLYSVPSKCSFKSLGTINDLTALQNSSNYYQFMIAIGITNNKYSYNMKLNSTIEHFNMYRDTLKEYGLGDITGIDLPNEKTGIIGSKVADDLLLNLSIGQYDTYTPIEVMQYINTIASNGYKYSPSLMKEVRNTNNEVILRNNYNYVSKVNLDDKYINRIKDGLNLVLLRGTGRGYVNKSLNPAGKTGTSESYYDSDNDGVVDTLTTTKSFASFVPKDDPKYSIVVISPNVGYDNPKNSYTSSVNRRISLSITNFLFDI